jgi:hypothetical protein
MQEQTPDRLTAEKGDPNASIRVAVGTSIETNVLGSQLFVSK